ncbi:universal stress protein [Saccharopolyspora phatthalungensis]|uniref:Nucleotide-binding universal stress UspA family protein n=1 Tax=Saccharopolyspora phatthalungensis TaxID=664693 RepID=A0A840Q9V8_9PSEU|nr:universal stress protein [Saccharopolyspora phatthalungensis]MBB5157564.1 nucleotide-binding universal stress UspA family protein [Saccharopolyspora phatthalungensis]
MAENKPRIVVGVDGSPGSRAALRWALRYAEHSNGHIVALIACGIPALIDVVLPMSEDDVAAQAERELRKAVEETRVLLGTRAPVEQRVVRDHAARALLDEAQEADLLVVGHRGHGGFVEALLGSVSQHCVHHAPCPVVVVRCAAGWGSQT